MATRDQLNRVSSVYADLHINALQINLSPSIEDLISGPPAEALMTQMDGLRRRTALDIGLVIPSVRARVDSSIADGCYQICLDGVPAAAGLAPSQKVMLIPDGELELSPKIAVRSVEPIFGLTAYWISSEFPSELEEVPHTIVTRQQTIVTHLNEIVRKNPGRLLSRQSVREMLNVLAPENPALVEEVDVGVLPLATLHSVLQLLLDEGYSIRNLRRIIERMTTAQAELLTFDQLVASARSAVLPHIST